MLLLAVCGGAGRDVGLALRDLESIGVYIR